MQVILKKQPTKKLRSLSSPEKKKIIKKLGSLRDYPMIGKPLQGKYKGYMSLKAWPYQIIYKLTGNSIFIFAIKHRQEAYKN